MILIPQIDFYITPLLLLVGVPNWIAIPAIIICVIMAWALIREIMDQFKK